MKEILIGLGIILLGQCKNLPQETKGVDLNIQQEQVQRFNSTQWSILGASSTPIDHQALAKNDADYSSCRYNLTFSEVKINSIQTGDGKNLFDVSVDSQIVATISPTTDSIKENQSCLHDQIMTSKMNFQRYPLKSASTHVSLTVATESEIQDIMSKDKSLRCSEQQELLLIRGHSHPLKVDLVACRPKIGSQIQTIIIGGLIQLDNNLVYLPESLIPAPKSVIWLLGSLK